MSKLGGGPGNTEVTGDVGIIGEVETRARSLANEMLTTTMSVTDVAAKLPATALADRRSYTIQNLDGSNTVYIGTNNLVTADRVIGTTSGFEIGPNENWNVDIEPTIDIYGITESGKTALVKITEIS